MITEIGIVAGEIRHYLDQHGETLFSELTSGIHPPADLTWMSVGWRAREGHVVVTKEGNHDRVSLR